MTEFNYAEDAVTSIDVGKLQRLKEDSLFLEALRAAGVNNWEGYSYARELYDEMTNAG